MKVHKIREAFDSFLEKRVVPLDKKIIVVIFVVVIVVPVVAFYFLHFTAKTNEIKGLENQAASLRQRDCRCKGQGCKA